MTTTATSRITAAVAGALMAAGILAGAAMTETRTQNMADYGSAITADDSTDAARSEGVPHMGNHGGSGHYFERMNGAGE